MLKKDYLFIDGYNVIHYSQALAALAASDLAHARERLQDIVCNYTALQSSYCAAIIFDAQTTESEEAEVVVNDIVSVVYTKQGETADSYIEKQAYALAQKGERVFVVTSDKHEQMQILGAGAYRISACEFLLDIAVAEKEYRVEIENKQLFSRNEMEDRLPLDVVLKLEKIRRSGGNSKGN